MRKEYEIKNPRKNPYAKILKEQKTIDKKQEKEYNSYQKSSKKEETKNDS